MLTDLGAFQSDLFAARFPFSGPLFPTHHRYPCYSTSSLAADLRRFRRLDGLATTRCHPSRQLVVARRGAPSVFFFA